jgi:predicted MFS family arabinose efflux permease
MYGVSEGPDKGWSSPQIVITITAGLLLLAAMVIIERRVAQPMVHLRLFGDRLFRACNELIFVTMVGIFGVLFVVPLYYQDGRGLSALGSGLSTFPEALGVMIGAQVVSRVLYPAFGPRRVMASGSIGIAIFTAAMALCGAHSSLWWMRIIVLGLGYSASHMIVSLQASAFTTITPASTGQASALFNANRQLGAAIGVAILSTIISVVGPVHHFGATIVPNLTAYHAAFLTASAIALAGGALALAAVRDEDASATRSSRRRGTAHGSAEEQHALIVTSD